MHVLNRQSQMVVKNSKERKLKKPVLLMTEFDSRILIWPTVVFFYKTKLCTSQFRKQNLNNWIVNECEKMTMPSIAFFLFFIYAISHKTRSWIKKWNATHAESLAQQHWACLLLKVHIIYLSSSNDVFLPFLPNQPTCVNVIAYVLAIFSSHIPSTHVHMGGEWDTFNQENLLCATSFNSNKFLVSVLL